MNRLSPSTTRYVWAFLAAALFFIGPRISTAQLTTLRVGTNSPASTEAVLFSIAKDIAKDNPKAKNLTISQLVDLSFVP